MSAYIRKVIRTLYAQKLRVNKLLRSYEQLTFDFIDEIVPIPECSGLMAMSGYKTPQALADEMVREARIWQKRNPGKDVMEVITPDWKEYVNHKIKELC